jgi:prolyl oligopeptidase
MTVSIEPAELGCRAMKGAVLALAATLSTAALAASCAEPVRPTIPPVTTATPPQTIEEAPSNKGTKLMTRKTDVVDVLHGVNVPDPYRWLEDGDSAEVKSWTETQNAHTRKILDAIGGREALKSEVTDLLQIGFVSAPTIRAGSA